MISTVSVHQAAMSHQVASPVVRGSLSPAPPRRLLNLQYLDVTDCVSLEDSGLKMVVENCPQLLYLFMRRCSNITGEKKCLESIHPFSSGKLRHNLFFKERFHFRLEYIWALLKGFMVLCLGLKKMLIVWSDKRVFSKQLDFKTCLDCQGTFCLHTEHL